MVVLVVVISYRRPRGSDGGGPNQPRTPQAPPCKGGGRQRCSETRNPRKTTGPRHGGGAGDTMRLGLGGGDGSSSASSSNLIVSGIVSFKTPFLS